MRRVVAVGVVISLMSAALSVVAVSANAQQLPPETPDPEGDTVDFGGNPTDGPDLLGVTAVEVTDYEGGAAWDLFEDVFDFIPGPGVVTIIPEEPGPLLAGSGPLVLVRARLSQPLPDAAYCQIVVAFRTEGLEQFSGSAGDPNNGNDTTLDMFLAGGIWLAGLTQYRSGSFSFVSDYNEVAAAIGNGLVQVVFPREAIPDGASWQIWVICGDDAISAGRDLTDLGSFLPGVIPTVSINPPTTTTTTTVTETTQTTANDTPTTTVEASAPTSLAAEEPGGGGGTVLLIVAVSLAIGAGLVWWIFNRKREGPCDCEMEKAAYDAALANYAAVESELGNARQLADDWRGRQSEARTEIVGLDALRPRRGEIPDPSEFEVADTNYRERRAELEANAEECGEELERAEDRVHLLEDQASELWGEAQTWLGIVRACWQKCFNAPFEPPVAPAPPGTGGADPGEDEGSDDGDDPRDTPPAADTEPECTGRDRRETVERTQMFTVPVDGMVRVSLSTDRGPLDDLDDIVSGNPVADTIAEFLSPDGSLELAPESLSGANAQRWQDAIEQMRTLSYAVFKREIYVNIAFDVEDVTLDCVLLEQCENSRWVKVGRRVDEKSRIARTLTRTWSETDSGGRPLGATMTIVNRDIEAAKDAARDSSDFRAGCR